MIFELIKRTSNYKVMSSEGVYTGYRLHLIGNKGDGQYYALVVDRAWHNAVLSSSDLLCIVEELQRLTKDAKQREIKIYGGAPSIGLVWDSKWTTYTPEAFAVEVCGCVTEGFTEDVTIRRKHD